MKKLLAIFPIIFAAQVGYGFIHHSMHVIASDNAFPTTSNASAIKGTTGATNATSGSFTFTCSSKNWCSYTCQLDGGSTNSCTSPYSTGGLTNEAHTLKVTAKNSAGWTESSPSTIKWLVNVDSVVFNGSTAQVDFGAGFINPNLHTTEFTARCWAYTNASDTQACVMGNARPGAASFGWDMCIISSHAYAHFGCNDAGGCSTGQGGSFTQSAWHHLLITNRNISGTYTGSAWLDGAQIGSNVTSSGNTDGTAHTKIGADGTASLAAPWNGYIDECFTSSVGFTSTDVAEDYNGGYVFDPRLGANGASVTHYWRLGDISTDSNTVIHDEITASTGSLAGSGIVTGHTPPTWY